MSLIMQNFNRNHSDMLDSVNFCSDKITTFEAMMKKVNEKLDMIGKLSQENLQLKTEVKTLNNRVDVLEQQIRSNNLDIQGVPEKQGENLLIVVQKIGEHLKCPIPSQDIDVVFRAKSRNPDNPRPIIVKLLHKKRRDDILAAAKTMRMESDNSAPGLKIENISNRMFINEHLTSLTKTVLKSAKDAAKTKNYKYVWVRDGCVFVRKDDHSRIIRVFSLDDVKKM